MESGRLDGTKMKKKYLPRHCQKIKKFSGESAIPEVKKNSIFELCMQATVERPFDVPLKAHFTAPDGTRITVWGFYDGDERFTIRFMPEQEGAYTYKTVSPLPALHRVAGSFRCSGVDGHGKVMPDGLYLKHADGTRHYSVGTTCYAWIYQPESVRKDTLSELEKGYFNKIRMCVFPKWYLYNEEQPELYPFEGTPGSFNYDTPNVKLFQQLDETVSRLRELDIQADIILFHPYDADNWGFSRMNRTQDEKYIRYVTARLGAFSNVWWSAANEYDLFRTGYKAKKRSWQHILRCIRKDDPYGHMLSIHQYIHFFNYHNPCLTHCSLQRTSMYTSAELTGDFQRKYRKPVIWDEIGYEGNIKAIFGNCTPEDVVGRFWEGTIRGGFAGHGETYFTPDCILWWAKGGKLYGMSPIRIRFLKEVMKDYGNPQFICLGNSTHHPLGAEEDNIFAWYFGNTQSKEQDIVLPSRHGYQVEIIDTWNMKRTILDGVFSGVCEVPMGGKPYMAVFARKVKSKPLPQRYTPNCLLRDLRYYPGGKKIYWLMTKTPVLSGNAFPLYTTLEHLQIMAGGAVTNQMVEEICNCANDGKLLYHLCRILKKRK